MAECRAVVLTEFNQPLEVWRVPIPDLPPGGMLVKIEAATLCGTDIHRWHGVAIGRESLPLLVGHEGCGIVAEINGERRDLLGQPLKPGDRVLSSYPACGECYYCTVARQPTLCPNTLYWGANRADRPPYLLGTCAEYQYIPPGSALIRVPEPVSSPLAAASSCALRTVMHGFERLGPLGNHETVVIQGCGPLGLFATAVAKHRGAHRVLLIGAPAARLDAGKALGADEVLNIDEATDPAERRDWVRQRTAGLGADVVIQVATASAVPEGVTMVRRGGRYLSIGGSGAGAIPVQTLPQMLSFVSIFMAEPRHWLQGVRFLADHPELPFDRMLSGVYSFDQASAAYEAMAKFEIVKPVFLPAH